MLSSAACSCSLVSAVHINVSPRIILICLFTALLVYRGLVLALRPKMADGIWTLADKQTNKSAL